MNQQMIPAWVEGTLQPREKLEVHRLGLRHPAISVFVVCGDQILIQQRALSKYHTPGLWANTCCTHPHWGEDMATAAHRRLNEELGITGLDLRPVGQIEYRAEVGQGLTEHEVVSVFVAHSDLDLPLALDPTEVEQTRWVDLHTLTQQVESSPQDFTPWLQIYLSQHREQIFG